VSVTATIAAATAAPTHPSVRPSSIRPPPGRLIGVTIFQDTMSADGAERPPASSARCGRIQVVGWGGGEGVGTANLVQTRPPPWEPWGGNLWPAPARRSEPLSVHSAADAARVKGVSPPNLAWNSIGCCKLDESQNGLVALFCQSLLVCVYPRQKGAIILKRSTQHCKAANVDTK